jgi:hypothetical protein
LISDDKNVREEAVDSGLWDRLCHQYTTYPASPYVVPYLLEVLRTGLVRDSEVRGEIFKYLVLIAKGGDESWWIRVLGVLLFWSSRGYGPFRPHRPSVPELIRAGKAVYAKKLGEPGHEIAENARVLWELCDSK